MTVISASVALAGCSDDDDDPVVLDDSTVTADDELAAGEMTGDDTAEVPAAGDTDTDTTTDAEPDVTLGDSPEEESATDTDAEGEGGTDAEGEGGTDAEGEGGTDAEGEGGTDAEGEGGTDAEGEGGTDAEGEGGTDAEGEGGTDAEGEGGTDAEGEGGTDAEGEGGTDAEGESGTDAEGEGGADAEGEGGTDAEGEGGTDAEGGTESGGALTPGVGNTALDFIVNSANHTTLAGLLLDNVALATTLDDPEQQFTIFAPTNAAIDTLDQATIEFLSAPENGAALERVLRYHVVAGSVQSMAVIDGVAAAGENGEFSVPTLAVGEPAQSLTFTANADGTGYNITDSLNITVPLTGPLDQNLSTDIEAPTTGIVHVIENVLRPTQAAAVADASSED